MIEFVSMMFTRKLVSFVQEVGLSVVLNRKRSCDVVITSPGSNSVPPAPVEVKYCSPFTVTGRIYESQVTTSSLCSTVGIGIIWISN